MANRDFKDVVVLASAARTASPTTVVQENTQQHEGMLVEIDCTAITASPSVVFTVQGYINGNPYTILASAAIVGTGKTYLKIFPGATNAANTVANDVIPEFWSIKAVHGNSDSITYKLTAKLLPMQRTV